MIKLEKEQTARFAARLEQETQESVMRDIAQFSEADIVDTWASEPPACAEVHAMVFNMERGVHIDGVAERTFAGFGHSCTFCGKVAARRPVSARRRRLPRSGYRAVPCAVPYTLYSPGNSPHKDNKIYAGRYRV